VCALVAGLASAPAFASQPPLVDDRLDVCANPGPGDSVVEARIVSFEQPRYDCGPDPGGLQEGWLDLLVALDPAQAPLRPTGKTGCLFGEMSAIVDDHGDPRPSRIDLRVDGVARTASYEHAWALCGLTPGHHTVEVPTDRGALVCAGDVRANEWRALAATSRGAILHLEPLRVAAGRQRALEPVAVEYDELRYGGYRARFDGFPPTAMLRIWTSPDGVLRAEPCLHPERVGAHPPVGSAAQPAPSPPPARGCAHCAVAGDEVSGPTTFLLLALAVARARRARRAVRSRP
jgi:hypothetical protein